MDRSIARLGKMLAAITSARHAVTSASFSIVIFASNIAIAATNNTHETSEFPAEFMLIYDGKINTHGRWDGASVSTIKEDIKGRLSTFCYTTLRQDGLCELRAPFDPKQLGIGGMDPRVTFRLHARDNRYAEIKTYYYGSYSRVTWSELLNGIKIGEAHIRALKTSP